MAVLLAAIVLSVAVGGGLALALLHARRRPVPIAAGLVHAVVALAGVTLLTVGVLSASHPLAVNAALLLFALAVIGGVFILLFRIQPESPPGFMIVLHGAVAAIALALLWAGIAAAG